MTQDEIISMARKAGASDWWGGAEDVNVPGWKWLSAIVLQAAAAEREACAKLAAQTVCDTHIQTGVKIYGTQAAKAIRSRSTHAR